MMRRMLEYPKHAGLSCVLGPRFSPWLQNHNFKFIKQSKHDYRPNMFWLFLLVVWAAFDGRADSRMPKTRRHVMCFFWAAACWPGARTKTANFEKQKRTKHHYRPHLRWPLICYFSAVFDGAQMLGCSKHVDLLYF